MTKNPLRDLLSRLLWDPQAAPSDVEIGYVSRSPEGPVEVVKGDALVRVTRDYACFSIGGREKWIPLHRIAFVREVASGKTLYVNPRHRHLAAFS